jgi:hypothetical protein
LSYAKSALSELVAICDYYTDAQLQRFMPLCLLAPSVPMRASAIAGIAAISCGKKEKTGHRLPRR